MSCALESGGWEACVCQTHYSHPTAIHRLCVAVVKGGRAFRHTWNKDAPKWKPPENSNVAYDKNSARKMLWKCVNYAHDDVILNAFALAFLLMWSAAGNCRQKNHSTKTIPLGRESFPGIYCLMWMRKYRRSLSRDELGSKTRKNRLLAGKTIE